MKDFLPFAVYFSYYVSYALIPISVLYDLYVRFVKRRAPKHPIFLYLYLEILATLTFICYVIGEPQSMFFGAARGITFVFLTVYLLYTIIRFIIERLYKSIRPYPSPKIQMEYATMDPQRILEALEQLVNQLEAFASSALEAILDCLESLRQWAVDATIRVKNYLVTFFKLTWKASVALSQLGLLYSPGIIFGIMAYYTGSLLLLLFALAWIFIVTVIIRFWIPQPRFQR